MTYRPLSFIGRIFPRTLTRSHINFNFHPVLSDPLDIVVGACPFSRTWRLHMEFNVSQLFTLFRDLSSLSTLSTILWKLQLGTTHDRFPLPHAIQFQPSGSLVFSGSDSIFRLIVSLAFDLIQMQQAHLQSQTPLLSATGGHQRRIQHGLNLVMHSRRIHPLFSLSIHCQ